MEQATERKPTAAAERRPQGGKTRRLAIDEERVVACAAPPCGSRFKGHRTFVVQDLMIRPHVVRFRRERWMRPDGTMVTAPLPAGIDGHFGPGLRRFVLAQYHHLQAASGLAADRRQGGLPRRSPRRAAGRAFDRGLDLGGRHWSPPQGRERLLHADRQCPLRLVRDHAVEEPRQLPRPAARRPRRLRRQ
jgi:hypothetical protein